MAKELSEMLPFTDDFIFSLVMQHPEICKALLARIIPEEEFVEIKLDTTDIAFLCDDQLTVETQKSLKFDANSHGVRFDAYVKSENTWVEIEMQTYTNDHIGKRSRYYHSNMDMDFLTSGNPYKTLKKSYVIFICTFDYMKKGAPAYRFQNYDTATDTYLDDDSYTIILNTSCPEEKVPDKLKPLYAYINGSGHNNDNFIKELDSYVQKYNSPEWRKKKMTLEHIIERERELATDRVNRLIQLLLEANRVDDIAKCTKDPEYQKKLFEEFDL